MSDESSMKGVILAGGTGSRLYPITHTGPKQLVPIGNKPILEYAIEDMVEAGIEEVGIILGQNDPEKIQACLGDGSDYGVDITYIMQGAPLGLAHAVGCAKDFVGDNPFVVYLGDNIMREGITDLVGKFDPDEYSAAIGLQRVDDPTRYGVVDLDEDGDIVGFVEKPDDPPSNLALIGVYIFTPSIFEFIEGLEPSWRGELEISDAIDHLLESGNKVQSHTVHGWWKDTGRPEDVLEANRLVLDDIERDVRGSVEDNETVTGRIEVGEGSVIKDGAVVRGPVSIGENTTIGSTAYVGPYTSIGDDCLVDQVHLESTIVIGESEINCDRKIIDSLIGRKTVIDTNEDKKPSGDRMVVSQNSELHL